MLKINKFGEALITIVDGDEIIYDGPPDADCIIEAMAFHFGEETEVEEHEAPEGSDPLKTYGTDSLSTEKPEYEFEEVASEESDEEESVNITERDGEDYPDDDE